VFGTDINVRLMPALVLCTVGLKNSRMILCLMSEKGLAPVRDHRADHSGDNMLLEYETALKVSKGAMWCGGTWCGVVWC
jgi:hypothetical protein